MVHRLLRRALQSSGGLSAPAHHLHCLEYVLRLVSDIRTIQELLGHNDVSTTMIYTRVIHQGGTGTKSPLDWL